MKEQNDFNTIIQDYYENVTLVESNMAKPDNNFMCYTKHTDSGILEFIVRKKGAGISKMTISRDNYLGFIR